MRIRHSWLSGLAIGVLACGGGNGGTEPSEDNPDAGDVTITNNAFTPSSLNVVLGKTVTWTWNSSGTVHNVTFDDGNHSNDQGSGTFLRTFSEAGTFPYHCTIHGPSMSGVVTVGTTGGGGGGDGGGDGGGGGGYIRGDR